jgi:tyrosine-protein kinase Etk/Wzc
LGVSENLQQGSQSGISAPGALPPQDGTNVLDLLVVLAKNKKLILGVPFLVAVLVSGLMLRAANVYTAQTKILPPLQGQSSASALLAQFAGLATLVGGGGGAIKNPNDIYVAILKSRTVEDNLVTRFDLMRLYDQKYPSRARRLLEQDTKITAGKEGIITIEFDDKDPKRAAAIANAYVEELLKLTQVLAVTEAAQRRLFFERQFNQAKENLAQAEAAARKGLQQGGLVKVDDQGRTMVEVTARLRAQITVKEVEISAMRTFAADQNPALNLAQQQLEAMKRELAKIEGTDGPRTEKAGAASQQGMDNLRLLRDVKYNEVVFEMLARQYEVAKLDEAKESSVIQVLDKAIEPDFKSKPNRAVTVVLSAVVSGFLVILWILVREGMASVQSDPQQRARIQELKRHLRRWRRDA